MKKDYLEKAWKIILAQQASYKKWKDFLLNFEYFQKRWDEDGFILQDDEILSKKYYSYENEIFYKKYSIPKWLSWKRDQWILSRELLRIYYAYGIHLIAAAENIFNVSKNLPDDIYASFCGHELTEKLKISYSASEFKIKHNECDYKKQYKKYFSLIKEKSKFKEEKEGVVVKLDIQNFFDNIQPKILIDFVISNRTEFEEPIFSDNDKKDFLDLFEFLMKWKGIVQSDKNLISGSLADLYLKKFDFYCIDLLRELWISFHFYRYIDDMVIIFENIEISRILIEILPKLEDFLFHELGLILNNKTKFFKIDNEDDWKEMMKTIKDVSQSDLYADEKWATFEKVYGKLEELHHYTLWGLDGAGNLNIPKNLYEINNVFSSSANILTRLVNDYDSWKILLPMSLKGILDDFNFEKTILLPKALIAIFESIPVVKEKFLQYFSWKIEWNKKDVYVVLKFLIHEEDFYRKNVQKIKNFPDIFEIIEDTKNVARWKERVYNFDLNEAVIEQIIMRRIAEIAENFSWALSHLANEFSEITFSKVRDGDRKDWNQKRIIEKLQKEFGNFAIQDVLNIQKLYNRRNKNNISHQWWKYVTRLEYEAYKKNIFNIYHKYLNK